MTEEANAGSTTENQVIDLGVESEHAAPSDAMTATTDDISVVAGDAPAAVLLVDLDSRSVVHANAIAMQLAPQAKLPIGLDEWADIAALRDLEGQELSESMHPLSRVARSEPVSGQAVSAARRSDLGLRREPLWVVGVPLVEAPVLANHALVVFLSIDHREAAQAAVDSAAQQAQLRERAVLATGMSFTVADAQADDYPLVWVNPAFTASSGYSFDEAVGRNCRFLQGPATDPAAPRAIREALQAEREVVVTLLNYRKDGTAFWNQLSVSPIYGVDGKVSHFVGIQTDVTGRVKADEERDRALRAERRAREDAEEAQGRLALLAEATSRLAADLDIEVCRERLIDLAVPYLADWALLITTSHGTDSSNSDFDILARHRATERQSEMARFVDALRVDLAGRPLQETLMGRSSAVRISDYDSPSRQAERTVRVQNEQLTAMADNLGAASMLVVPVPGRLGRTDVLVLVRGVDSARHTESDLQVAVDLGRRAGLILDNARLYEEQHSIAATLQDSLLPTLPKIEGIVAAARYRAAASGAQVGGDFYELIELPNHDVGIAIGDVVGHDVLAAAAMGHLRGLLRATAWSTPADAPVSSVLERVDEMIAGLAITTMASLIYARLSRADDGGWIMEHTNAGHLPLLLKHPDGRVEQVSSHHDLLLGVAQRGRRTQQLHLEPGTMLLAYTDGLIERRDENLDAGLERLAEAFAGTSGSPEVVCEHVIASLGTDGDDVVVLAVCV